MDLNREHVSSGVGFKTVEHLDLEASLSENSCLSPDLPLRPQLGFGILIEATSHFYGCGNRSNSGGESTEGKKKNLKLEICAEEI